MLASAGIDVFQTDYALDVALQGKALVVKPELEIKANATDELLRKFNAQKNVIDQDREMALAICAEQAKLDDSKR